MLPFTTTTLLTKKDVTAYLYRSTYKKPYYAFVSLFGLYLLGTGVYDMAKYYSSAPLAMVLAGAFLVLVPSVNILIAIRNTFLNRVLLLPVTYTFSDDAITIHASTIDAVYKWEHIIKATEEKVYLLLYVSKKSANLIKKDGLTRQQIDFILERTNK